MARYLTEAEEVAANSAVLAAIRQHEGGKVSYPLPYYDKLLATLKLKLRQNHVFGALKRLAEEGKIERRTVWAPISAESDAPEGRVRTYTLLPSR